MLTPKIIDNWQVDHGEDFLIDGPISEKSWGIFHDEMVKQLKADPLLGKYMDPKGDDVEEMLADPLDDSFWESDKALKAIWDILCNSANKTGADILADITAY